jgi:hypothetical protein
MRNINDNKIKEAKHCYAIYSMYDSPYAFSRLTSEWETMDASHAYNSPEYDHLATRDLSTEIQYNLVTYHAFEAPTQSFLSE